MNLNSSQINDIKPIEIKIGGRAW